MNPLKNLPEYHSDSDSYCDEFQDDHDRNFSTIRVDEVDLDEQTKDLGCTQDVLEGNNVPNKRTKVGGNLQIFLPDEAHTKLLQDIIFESEIIVEDENNANSCKKEKRRNYVLQGRLVIKTFFKIILIIRKRK